VGSVLNSYATICIWSWNLLHRVMYRGCW